jgi:hypothetical protein
LVVGILRAIISGVAFIGISGAVVRHALEDIVGVLRGLKVQQHLIMSLKHARLRAQILDSEALERHIDLIGIDLRKVDAVVVCNGVLID